MNVFLSPPPSLSLPAYQTSPPVYANTLHLDHLADFRFLSQGQPLCNRRTGKSGNKRERSAVVCVTASVHELVPYPLSLTHLASISFATPPSRIPAIFQAGPPPSPPTVGAST